MEIVMEENIYLESLKHRNYEMYKYFNKGIEIISELKSKMYEAYLVGGAVRDFLLNRDFNDIDIATNATPDEVSEIFKNYQLDSTYAQWGCITIIDAGFRFEITTFRNEEYVKYKIKDVHYSKKLVDDVIRRDYTISALALTPNLTIIDLVDGQKDLEKGIVRVIGSGKRRFKDDPSRMLRGIGLVARYGYEIESNTMRAMRKSKPFLKEVSELKITLEMAKMLESQYGLRALHLIDDHNLFRYLPNYAYWVKIMMKHYKKLTYIEKFVLLYRITGKLPENIALSKEKAVTAKKLYDLSQMLSVSKVEPMMVFSYPLEDLLAADRISKAYNKRYRKQKNKIKQIHKKLPISKIAELNFSARELSAIVREDQKHLISGIMDEILYKVVNKELPNLSDILRNEALKLLSQSTFEQRPTQEEVDTKKTKPLFFKKEKKDDSERYFDDQHAERELLEKVYDEQDMDIDEQADEAIPFDMSYYEQLAKDQDESSEASIDEETLSELKREYDEDYTHIYSIYMKSIQGFATMSISEQQARLYEIKQQAKAFLLQNNPKYNILLERGII